MGRRTSPLAQSALALALEGDYPTTWDAFVGQQQAKRQLMVAARSAATRGATLDHCLLSSGVPGIGKTSLGLLTAAEMRSNVKVVSGKVDANAARLLFGQLKDGDVLFIDEIHTLVAGGKAKAEWLLHYMQDGVLMGPIGPEKQPKVTIIGATTDGGKLPDPIVDRFIHKPTLVPYSDTEVQRIALGMAARLFDDLPLPTGDDLAIVAAAANNNPRKMRGILTTMRDLAVCEGVANVHQALGLMGVTLDGLDTTAQRYLVVLATEFGGAAGERALRDRLQEGAIAQTERVLMDKGLIARTRGGRTLTQAGIRRASDVTL